MNDEQGKLNLPSIHYYQGVGEENCLISYLNCFQSCLYNILKTEWNDSDEDLLEIFLGDITFGLVENKAGLIHDICFYEGAVNQFGFKINYILGQGIGVLSKVEELLDRGKIVVIQTYMQRVPFFFNFLGYDYPLDEEHYRQNYQIYHTFLLIGHDRDHLYYVDTPYVRNKERYIPYEGNNTIGVIEKKELYPAFDAFFNYTYLEYDEQRPTDVLDFVKTVMDKSVKNYLQPSCRTNDTITYYGKEALDHLTGHLQPGVADLSQMLDNYNIKLDYFLVWKLQFVLNRRYILWRTLVKHAGRFDSPDMAELIELLYNGLKAWRVFAAMLKKLQARKITKIDAAGSGLFQKVASYEMRIIEKIKKLV